MSRIIFFISLLALGSCDQLWLDAADIAEEQAEVNRLVLAKPFADFFSDNFVLTEQNFRVFIAQVKADTLYIEFKKEPTTNSQKVWKQAEKEAKEGLVNLIVEEFRAYMMAHIDLIV